MIDSREMPSLTRVERVLSRPFGLFLSYLVSRKGCAASSPPAFLAAAAAAAAQSGEIKFEIRKSPLAAFMRVAYVVADAEAKFVERRAADCFRYWLLLDRSIARVNTKYE